MPTASKRRDVLSAAIFLVAVSPFLRLVYWAFSDGLGVNPIETITKETGIWTLRFLLVTLAVTPIRRLTPWKRVIGYRRMLGLFAFFYGSLHVTTYVVFDHFFAIDSILDDIALRPYITAGFTAYVLLVPLALTSTAGMIRRLGGRRWQLLHRLVYVSAAAGVVHYLWLVKLDPRPPLMYAGILAGLLLIRIGYRYRGSVRRSWPREHTMPVKVDG